MKTKIKSTNRIAGNGATAEAKVTVLPSLQIGVLRIWIEGDSELICNRKTPEAMGKILLAQQRTGDKAAERLVRGKENRDPEAEYKRSLYPHPDGGFGVPGSALRKAFIASCTDKKVFPKTLARKVLFVVEEIVKVEGEPHMRNDMVKLKSGGADLRFRAGFTTWSMNFTVRYDASLITRDMILTMFNKAGFGVGIGDWRPEKDGNKGQFHVTKVAEVEMMTCPICEARTPGTRWCRTCRNLGIVFALLAICVVFWLLGLIGTWEQEAIQEGRRF